MPQWVWAAIVFVLALAFVYVLLRPVGRKETVKESKPPARESAKKADPAVPTLEYEEDVEVDPTQVGEARAPTNLQPPAKKIVYDEDAASDEPTHSGALILVTARAQTDRGLRRKRNEDSILALDDIGLYVVADGMGGYRGGEIASALSVSTIEAAYRAGNFPGVDHEGIPRRASELARAIQSANQAILDRAADEKALKGMGTTICAAHFSPNKQRVYIGHVGDSRAYRFRGGELEQITADHTMKDLGVKGPGSEHLSRAVGIWPAVLIDVILSRPHARDLYLLCSDGLTKMLSHDEIQARLAATDQPSEIVESLISAANSAGGKDNISVIVIRVDSPVAEANGQPS